MKTFEFEIKEVLARIVEIDANTEDEAFQKLTEMYQKEEIVLDNSDFVETEINKFKDE